MGKGKSYQGQKGDLILKINIAQSPEYTRENDTLTKYFDVPLKTALFGGKVEIKTIHKDITLKIPQNTKQNQKFHIKKNAQELLYRRLHGAIFQKVFFRTKLYKKCHRNFKSSFSMGQASTLLILKKRVRTSAFFSKFFKSHYVKL